MLPEVEAARDGYLCLVLGGMCSLALVVNVLFLYAIVVVGSQAEKDGEHGE